MYAAKLRRSCTEIDPDSLERLVRYSWPGNVRELANVIERALILSHEPVLRIDDHLLGLQDRSFTSLPSSESQGFSNINTFFKLCH